MPTKLEVFKFKYLDFLTFPLEKLLSKNEVKIILILRNSVRWAAGQSFLHLWYRTLEAENKKVNSVYNDKWMKIVQFFSGFTQKV